MRRLWAAAFLLRRLRADPGVAALVFLLVGGTAFLFASGPRLLNQAADAGLQHALVAARTTDRNIQISIVAADGDAGQPLAQLATRRAAFEQTLPESVRSLVDGSAVSVESIRFGVTDAPNRTFTTTFVRLRYQDGLDPAITVVDGRMP
ncbi:MAG TPA: hypothetical protein VK838_04725, partial [Candidatus Limnocylindrales bacterium]|nr:hypothetical protein [Candidatus Limnocylindrales bacterium]